MDAWLSRARDAIVTTSGLDASQLELDAHDERTLLALARIAAHVSGDRTNAPLLCYLVGCAVGSGVSLDEVAEAVRRASA